MAAYLIIDIRRVLDEEKYATYRSRVSAGLAEAGGEYLVRGGAVKVLEGDWSPNRIVVAVPFCRGREAVVGLNGLR